MGEVSSLALPLLFDLALLLSTDNFLPSSVPFTEVSEAAVHTRVEELVNPKGGWHGRPRDAPMLLVDMGDVEKSAVLSVSELASVPPAPCCLT